MSTDDLDVRALKALAQLREQLGAATNAEAIRRAIELARRSKAEPDTETEQ